MSDLPDPSIGYSGWGGPFYPDERVLWRGRPGLGHVVNDRALQKSAMGALTASIGLILLTASISRHLSFPPYTVSKLPFGIAIAGLSFYLMFGQYVWSSFVRRFTCYMQTGKRAFILVKFHDLRSLKSYSIDTDTEITGSEGLISSIWFAEERVIHPRSSSVRKIGFQKIDNVERVYDLIRKIQERSA